MSVDQAVIAPSGIHNPGNFCYIISSLQCLKHLNPLKEYFNDCGPLDEKYTDIMSAIGLHNPVGKAEMQNIVKREIALLKSGNEEKFANVKEKYKMSRDELEWFLGKIFTENTKIYLYIVTRELLRTINIRGLTVNPMGFLRICRQVFNDFGMGHLCDGNQNDAQEFLTVLIDYLHDSHSIPTKTNIPKAILDLSESELDANPDIKERIKCGLYKEITTRYGNGVSTIYKQMYFYNLNQILCSKCRFSALNYCPNNILCVPTDTLTDQSKRMVDMGLNPNVGGTTIYDCLDAFFCEEKLDGDYACNKCKNKSDMIMKRHMITMPKTLIISLKRFVFNPQSGGLYKNNIQIDYPLLLDVSKYSPIEHTKSETTQYRLIGVVNHSGALNFGHYYSYNSIGGVWWCHNDGRVFQIKESDVICNNQNAYILFYEQL